jgi:hypothetical protein
MGPTVIPIEAKVTATPRPEHAGGIAALASLLPGRVQRGLLVCLCAERFPLTAEADAVPLDAM